MADQSDVEITLATQIAAILYPQGTDAPSILNRLCRIYRGWPRSAALDDDLANGHVNVTIFPEPRHQNVTTRYPGEFQIVTPTPATYTTTTTATTVTIAGTPAAAQLVGVLVDEIAVVHRTMAPDLPELVAAIIAAGFTPYRIALVSGATINFPDAGRIIARSVADQHVQSETRRQLQGFRVSLWCPDPSTRDAAGAAIDAALSAMAFVALPDGSAGRLAYHGSMLIDHAENAALFRRDLHYTVEYATTLAATLPAMLFGDVTIAPPCHQPVRACLG